MINLANLKFKRIFIYLAVLLLTLISAFQIDDRLSPETIELLQMLDTASESKAYLFLSGMYVEEGEDPIERGRQDLQELLKYYHDYNYEIEFYPNDKKLPIPTSSEFCNIREPDCLKIMFSNKYVIDELWNENLELIRRSNNFFKFQEFATQSKTVQYAPIPALQHLRAAERLKTLKAIRLFKAGNFNNSISILEQQIKENRNALALHDSLVGKLIFTVIISELIDVLSIIIDQSDVPIESIENLTTEEKSLAIAFAREFGSSYETLNDLDQRPNRITPGPHLPKWIRRIFFKPNMTINAIAPFYYKAGHVSEFTPSEFSKYISSYEFIGPTTSKIRNKEGRRLVWILPEFYEYVGMLMDLEAKIYLFNQYHKNESDRFFNNPYFETETPFSNDNGICFKGALEDKRAIRCLKLDV